jgi:hypothetical protein
VKKEDLNIGEFVEKRLDQISDAGEWLGSRLGGVGRGVKNVFIAVGVLIVFGLAAFLWAMGKGLMKKGK